MNGDDFFFGKTLIGENYTNLIAKVWRMIIRGHLFKWTKAVQKGKI